MVFDFLNVHKLCWKVVINLFSSIIRCLMKLNVVLLNLGNLFVNLLPKSINLNVLFAIFKLVKVLSNLVFCVEVTIKRQI